MFKNFFWVEQVTLRTPEFNFLCSSFTFFTTKLALILTDVMLRTAFNVQVISLLLLNAKQKILLTAKPRPKLLHALKRIGDEKEVLSKACQLITFKF